MKILYIHQYFKTREGNSSTRSYEFAKKLIDSGNQVTMLTGDSRLTDKEIPIKKGLISKEYLIDGIRVIAVKNSYSNYMSKLRRIFAFISFLIIASLKGVFMKSHNIIYATSTPLTVGIPAMIINFFRNTPFVFEVRDLWPEAPIQMGIVKNKRLVKLLTKLEKTIYKRASHIVTLSPGMTEGVLKCNVPASKISMIPNSCDIELFDSQNSNPSTYQDKYNLTESFVAMHPGSMGIANGLTYIVEAAKILNDMNNEHVKILLTGDGATRPQLEKYCEENNLKNVIFTGNIAKYEMPNLISASDITITSFLNIPILATNSPNKFFDSLAAGKPVIVNSNGWTKDMVLDNQIGYYVDPEKPKELALLLDNLSRESNSNLIEMGKKSRRLALEKFDRNKLAIKLEKILFEFKK